MNEHEHRLWQMLHARDKGLLELKQRQSGLNHALAEQRDDIQRVVSERKSTIEALQTQKQELRLKIAQLQQERKALQERNRAYSTFPERQVLKYVDGRLDEMRRSSPVFWILNVKAWMLRSLKRDLRKAKGRTPKRENGTFSEPHRNELKE
ncbi:hypothetical protein [Verrucomicrobium sp. BvORR106]|uniref:hypothetical protein n=1 Tax=Verrucomicrobium sp. BvORR106 TaxID=1403819 RepID=UPI0005715EDA|nr:hypothetical protein [Verrucomicrobium sp. BvORR106]